MIDYDKVTLTVVDVLGKPVGTLYSPLSHDLWQAYDIKLQHNSNGWKELSFTLPTQINGEESPLIGQLLNEYRIEIDDGRYQDVFILSENKITHNTPQMTADVRCNHASSRLRMKKLYLMFDDTNGIGTCSALLETILDGTGWTLRHCDTFLEEDGQTEKVRTLQSGGKEGAYQLINKVCDLFNARPVYNGKDRTLDVYAFSPYSFKDGEAYPTVHNMSDTVELCYSKGMAGVTRSLNTENLITRLYVEGSYGEDGYVGIESANPTGMNFILNFDYFKAIGAFTDDHQEIVDNYLTQLAQKREEAKTADAAVSAAETRLMELWGTSEYSLYRVDATIDTRTFDLTYLTSLNNKQEDIVSGQKAVILLDDGKHIYTQVDTVSGQRVSFTDNINSGASATDIVIFKLLPSGTIGGKEAAMEAAQEMYDKLSQRVGDNLLIDSDTIVSTSSSAIHTYTMTDDWKLNTPYVVSLYGTVNDGNAPSLWTSDGGIPLGIMTYDEAKRTWIRSFTLTELPSGSLRTLHVQNTPTGSASSATITKIKLEYGELPTPWSPASNSSAMEILDEYLNKIEGLLQGTNDAQGLYALYREAVSQAKLLQEQRDAYDAATAAIKGIETAFANAMGDLLRDGYWQDDNYIPGQDENLYRDAVKTHAVMSKPVAEYSLSLANMVGMDAAPHMRASITSAAHIIDDTAAINAWGYIEQIVYALDDPYSATMKVSTHEARFAGQSFTQVLSAVAETAKDIQSKKGMFSRAALISSDGKLSADALDGAINVEATRLLSTTSNWHTDESGNIIFVAQDGSGAMKLTGEGFMIASGKTPAGDWDWRTLGTGRGLIADEITGGTLQAGIVKILGTDQFVWDGDNIYISDPQDPRRQVRIGRYDGRNYGIGFTKDDGATWTAAFGFDGINLNYATMDISQIQGLEGAYLTPEEAAATYATLTNVGAINSALQELNSDVRQNIQFTAGGIIIQQAGNETGFSSRFTSTALEFYQGSDKIGWFENRALYVDNVMSNKRFGVGHLIWSVTGDSSVAVKWDNH